MVMLSLKSPVSRRLRTLSGGAVVALLSALALVGTATADAARPTAHAVPAPPLSPTRANQIQNLDQVRTAIKAYYGDTLTATPDPVDGTTLLHTFAADGAYAREMAGIERVADTYLKHPYRGTAAAVAGKGKRAILLDVDDTTLNTYNYEIYSNFVYNPVINAAFVNSAAFPAVPGMPSLVRRAKAEGYAIFFLTGRPETQRPGTTENLLDVKYPAVPASQIYLKDQTDPWLASCAPTCTTIQYKSLTRKHIESQGYRIIANFGDQYSDLAGGYARKTFKLPNPMYYLP